MKIIKIIFASLLSLVLAIGTLNLLQMLAWAGMLLNFSQDDHLELALSKTFDGDHPCPLCLAVKEAREQEETSPIAPPEKREKGASPPDFFASRNLSLTPPHTRATEASSIGLRPLLANQKIALQVPTPPPRLIA